VGAAFSDVWSSNESSDESGAAEGAEVVIEKVLESMTQVDVRALDAGACDKREKSRAEWVGCWL
jgi:hypothetical protein